MIRGFVNFVIDLVSWISLGYIAVLLYRFIDALVPTWAYRTSHELLEDGKEIDIASGETVNFWRILHRN